MIRKVHDMTKGDLQRKTHIGKAWEMMTQARDLAKDGHFLDAEALLNRAAQRMRQAAEVPANQPGDDPGY